MTTKEFWRAMTDYCRLFMPAAALVYVIAGLTAAEDPRGGLVTGGICLGIGLIAQLIHIVRA